MSTIAPVSCSYSLENADTKTHIDVQMRDRHCLVTNQKAIPHVHGGNFTGLEVAHIFPLMAVGNVSKCFPHHLFFSQCLCQGSCPSSSSRPHLHLTGPPTSSGPSGRTHRTHRTLPASVLFSSCTLVCSLSITGRPSTCYLHPPSVYVSIPGPRS